LQHSNLAQTPARCPYPDKTEGERSEWQVFRSARRLGRRRTSHAAMGAGCCKPQSAIVLRADRL